MATDEHELMTSHALAHDLRSPLRAVEIYADLLTTELGGGAPEPARLLELCASIARAAAEMTDRLDAVERASD